MLSKACFAMSFTLALFTGLTAAGCAGAAPDESEEADSETDGLNTSNNLSGTKQPNGITLETGLVLPKGYVLPSNTDFSSKGIMPLSGVTLSTGFDLGNGKQASKIGYDLGGGSISPKGDLLLWLQSHPTNNHRILKYLVECALPDSRTVKLSDFYGSATYHGIFGFGTSILQGQMTTSDQEKVSACLLARVNQQGMSATIEMVGSPNFGNSSFSSKPADAFDGAEASFGGNVFLAAPQAFMCFNGPFGSSYDKLCSSRACDAKCDITPDENKQGTCGMINFVPHCSSVCDSDKTGAHPYHNGCYDSGAKRKWPYMISTYLPTQANGASCAGDWECTSANCNNSVCAP